MQMVKYPTQLKETKSSCNPRKIIIVSIQLPSTVSSILWFAKDETTITDDIERNNRLSS